MQVINVRLGIVINHQFGYQITETDPLVDDYEDQRGHLNQKLRLPQADYP